MLAHRFIHAALFAAALVTLALAPPSIAATVRVPADQPTIQAGIGAASAGDTVLVAPGTYSGPGNRDLSFGGTDLVLLSEAGASLTSIDTQGAGRGLVFENGETSAAVIDGFTIENAAMPGEFGGGILCTGASPTIRNCDFSNNTANAGGGIYARVNSAPTISGCRFLGNSGLNHGGGIYATNSALTASGCVFSGNSAGWGGGVYQRESISSMDDCRFDSNEGTNSGGGIYTGTTSSLALIECEFEGNSSALGGGVHSIDSTLELDGCDFVTNEATQGGGVWIENAPEFTATDCTWSGNYGPGQAGGNPRGGGIYCRLGTSMSLTRCDLINNWLESQDRQCLGGGMYMSGVQSAVFTDCTFQRNSSSSRGGFLYCPASTVTFTDCFILDNTSTGDAGGCWFLGNATVFSRCTISGNRAGSLPSGERRGGGIMWGGTRLAITECTVSDNVASGNGGGMYVSSGWYWGDIELTDCTFSRNAGLAGGGIYMTGPGRYPAQAAPGEPGPDFRQGGVFGCTFDGNSAGSGGAVHVRYTNPAFTDCILVGNSAPLGGAICWQDSALFGSVLNCTLAGNSGSMAGSGMALTDTCAVTIDNTIIAFGLGAEAVFFDDDGSVASLACTDIYGNEGGDWTSYIQEQLGINGNFSADPLFCAPFMDDYTLAEISPCAPENSPAGCGLIGALPVACVNPIGVAAEAAPPIVGRLRVTPNPIRQSGLIEWVNESGGAVSLRLYDPLGRLVFGRELGRRPEGREEMRWEDLVGRSRLRAGAYFLELGAPSGGRAGVRVILLR